MMNKNIHLLFKTDHAMVGYRDYLVFRHEYLGTTISFRKFIESLEDIEPDEDGNITISAPDFFENQITGSPLKGSHIHFPVRFRMK